MNGGTCDHNGTQVSCICPATFAGPRCEWSEFLECMHSSPSYSQCRCVQPIPARMVEHAGKSLPRWPNACAKQISPAPLAAYVIHVPSFRVRMAAVVQHCSPTLVRIGRPTVVSVHRVSTDRIVIHVNAELEESASTTSDSISSYQLLCHATLSIVQDLQRTTNRSGVYLCGK